MRIAIHQPNFVPWFPFFYKMAMSDVFVLLKHVQFEKNGYQNRFLYKDKWITKPVKSGLENILDKEYIGKEGKDNWGNSSLFALNKKWIECIAETLNIDTKIVDDDLFHETRPKDKTDKLIDIIKTRSKAMNYEGKLIYITNPSARDKYLDEDRMWMAGIDIEYCKVPKNLQKSIFEMFEEYGIEGTIRQLPKRESIEKYSSVF